MDIVALNKVDRLGACLDGLDWFRGQPDAATAWAACPRFDWLAWAIRKLNAAAGRTAVRACRRISLLADGFDLAPAAVAGIFAAVDAYLAGGAFDPPAYPEGICGHDRWFRLAYIVGGAARYAAYGHAGDAWYRAGCFNLFDLRPTATNKDIADVIRAFVPFSAIAAAAGLPAGA